MMPFPGYKSISKKLEKMSEMRNPLLSDFNTPFKVPPFSVIKNEHFLPAIEEAINQSRTEIKNLLTNKEEPTFENTIEIYENGGKYLSQASSILFNLNHAETSPELQQITMEASVMMTNFSNEVSQNVELFSRIKEVYNKKDDLDLKPEQLTLLKKTYKGFVRNGADLNDADKKRFAEIKTELSQLNLKFNDNVLAETNSYELVLENQDDLVGLPDYVIEAASETAESKGHEGKWVFTLQAPSYLPFMENSEKRELREKMFKAHMCKAFQSNEFDNQENIRKIIQYRAELARLLGFDTYADYVLEERMAMKVSAVDEFLEELLEKSLKKAKSEVSEIQNFIKSKGDDIEVQRWDWAYYSEKLKKERYNIDDDLLKPYFKLENVLNGVFEVATKLYGIQFVENKDIPVYHPDVKAYEVLDESNQHVSVFYADFFPRTGKSGGAWMTSYRDQHMASDGQDVRPVVSIVCNFTKPTASKPSLLTYDEVNTLFHEFGHALHGMLSKASYQSTSGTSVFWDFVELPSQIMENWVNEKECLDLFAKHYETDQLIPAEYVDRIIESSKYHEAYATVRQISFGLLDLAWHGIPFTSINDYLSDSIYDFERLSLDKTELFPIVPDTCMSTQFTHIFAGGYGAGYYSYKWAEVLDADAFSLFKKNGVFDKRTAQSFKENILEKGGSEHPMELYKRFRGQEPTIDALLLRSGLTESTDI